MEWQEMLPTLELPEDSDFVFIESAPVGRIALQKEGFPGGAGNHPTGNDCRIWKAEELFNFIVQIASANHSTNFQEGLGLIFFFGDRIWKAVEFFNFRVQIVSANHSTNFEVGLGLIFFFGNRIRKGLNQPGFSETLLHGREWEF
jgi:hypothetical protein